MQSTTSNTTTTYMNTQAKNQSGNYRNTHAILRIAIMVMLSMSSIWVGAAESVATLTMQESTSSQAYCYRIVNANLSTQIYATTDQGGYGVKLKLRANTDAAEDFWYFIPGDEGYYISNRATGQYMYYNASGDSNAKIELSSTKKSLFVLTGTTYGSSSLAAYMIAPKDNATEYFNPHGGASGYISLYDDENDNNSKWMLRAETAVVRYAAPEITVTGWNVTITTESTATIYYTTDGTVPTTGSNVYGGPFSHEQASLVLARVIADDGASEIAYVDDKTAVPTYSFTSDKTKAVLTAPENATLYYTTNGTDPTNASTQVAAGNTEEVALSVASPIKVMAREEGKLKSDVVTIEERELGVAPVGSTDDALKAYRIVHARWHLDGDTRYLYPTSETGTYGRWLKTTSEAAATVESEQYWYLMDAGDGYYYLQNAMTGEYLYRNTVEVNNQDRIEMTYKMRTRFKISAAKYERSGVIYDVHDICPEGALGVSFNPANGSKDDGWIATYGTNDVNSHWFFTDEVSAARCSQPTISLVGQNVVITVPSGSTVHYTTDGTLPTSSSAEYTDPFTHESFSAGQTVLAVAVSTDDVNTVYNSEVYTKVLQASTVPSIAINGDYTKVTISNGDDNATLYYTTDGTSPSYDTDNSTTVTGTGDIEIAYADCEGKTIQAFALQNGYLKSAVAEMTVGVLTPIDSDFDFATIDPNGVYYLTEDITLSSHTSITDFTGIFDGNHHTISGLTAPLFASTDDATIKNVVLDKVSISGGTGNVGALVGTASGDTRIYNCGVLDGTVGGGDNVGSIVGELQGSARVVNCYSFANITGGTTVGGIVGNNTTASTSDNLQTLVMSCMYYGDITGGTNVSPIYGGTKISNAGATGINNYNYYRHEANITPTAYNCALAAEERYLTRFEFYRHVLNSQRRLSAFYVTGNVDDHGLMAKWVLDTEVAPYPILKPWGKYASCINKNNTKVLNSLSVSISGQNATGTALSQAISINITDIDAANHDYNYYKVQLPYYNDYFDDNYTNDKVVTGWKITAVTTDGTVEEYNAFSTTGNGRYNFADRYCTEKDLYSVSGRVFAQGGYYNVPEGVTGITIEPYWGKAVYLSDAAYDVVYTTGYAGSNYQPTGLGLTPDAFNGQTVHKSLSDVWGNLQSGGTVFDNAIVLCGNYHSYNETWENSSGGKPFTITSVDMDKDNEPDYSLYFKTSVRPWINPVRFDFINHVALGMAAKVDGSNTYPNIAIFRPRGWFEITETALAIYEEFEYDWYDAGKALAPLILNGGIFNQFCSINVDYYDGYTANRTQYIIVGGNCYFEDYTPGCQIGEKSTTVFPPVSVLGGEYENFYLSGVRAEATPKAGHNALCYGNGGKIGLFAGACQEAIDGDVIIKLDHMLIDEFYGGGVNDKKPITGSIDVTINNSLVGTYCGGPKFGNMAENKTVTTYAENTVFNSFYGGGYGGTSLFRGSNADVNNQNNYNTDWFTSYYADRRGTYYDGTTTLDSRFTPIGILVDYEMEHFCYAGGGSVNARFHTDYASLSVAEVRNVTTTLKGCTINGDLYGGGNLGKVNGTLNTTLEDCIVNGSVYAGGYSAAVPTCEVMPTTAPTYSTYNTNTGIFTPAEYPTPDIYTWAQADAALVNGQTYIDEDKKEIYTKAVDLSDLGTVRGNTILQVTGATHVTGSVYGGGNESKIVDGRTKVVIDGAGVVIEQDVFGGGNRALVQGNTSMQLKNGTINGNVFGAGNLATVEGNTRVAIIGGEVKRNVYGGGNQAAVSGKTNVIIGGGPETLLEVEDSDKEEIELGAPERNGQRDQTGE